MKLLLDDFRSLRRWLLSGGVAAAVAIAATALPGATPTFAGTQEVAPTAQAMSQDDALATTVAYVEQFYPLWFTYYQSQYASVNRLAGPDRVSPLYQIVVAINVDTLYASTFVDLAEQPLILSIPATTVSYSVLTLDPYGDIFESGVPSQSPGTALPATTYALTGPGFQGTLPAGVTRIEMPLDFTTLIFRADRFSPEGEDQTDEANQFRMSLETQSLCLYEHLPCPSGSSNGGTTLIVPEVITAVPFKTAADELIAHDPIAFLKQMQVAVASSNTPPLSPLAQDLSERFDRLFGSGDFSAPGSDAQRADFVAGARAAHQAMLDRYLTHTDATNWIHFTNIGAWGDDVVERSAITEFIQYGNGIATAAYYHAFKDGNGVPLDGSRHGYVLNFPAGQLPDAERFWSITAYTPSSVELVRNSADKYVVARYTPGLAYNADGSLSVYMTSDLPKGVPAANWLPIPRGRFNVMLRVYGVVPDSSVADDTYVPPAIRSTFGVSPVKPSSGRLPRVERR